MAHLWNGSPDLEPMYAAYGKQAAYGAAHGFELATVPIHRRQRVTRDIVRRVLEITAGAGLDAILWLWGGAEYEWDINSREPDPVFTYFEGMIKFIDTMPDIARTIKYICYAPEFSRIGTYEEAEGYLSWAFPMYRRWLASTKHMQGVKLSAGMDSSRLENDLMKERAYLLAAHTDIFGFSEYPQTDENVQLELDIWAKRYELLGTPIMMQEMNNIARMGTAIDYAEENHWGFVPYSWLAHWINHGTEIICLHRGNNSYNPYAQWFDIEGNPTPWLTDGGLVDAIANRGLHHGYVLIKFPDGWSLGNLIRARTVLTQMGLQADHDPDRITHGRFVSIAPTRTALILEGVFDPYVLNAHGLRELIAFQLNLDAASFEIEVTPLAFDQGWAASGDACREWLAAVRWRMTSRQCTRR